MSRLTNLSNLRIPHFNSWKNNWFEHSKYYSLLFFRDFQLFQYLKGLFYKLKMISDDFYLDHLTNNFLYLKLNIFLYKFQIRQYFLTFFNEQYLLYSFFLQYKKIIFFKNQLDVSFFYYLNPVLVNSSSFLFDFLKLFYFFNISKYNDFFDSFFLMESNYYILRYQNKKPRRSIKSKGQYSIIDFINSNHSSLHFLYKIRYFFSLSYRHKRLRNKYSDHFFKFKLRKKLNIISSNLIHNKSNLFINTSKIYFFIFFLRNLFYSLFLFNHFDFSFISFFYLSSIKKINLLKTLILFFISFKHKSLNLLFYIKQNYKRELARDVFDERTYYDFFYYFFFYFFILNVERTLFLFTGNSFLFVPQFYFFRKFPAFLSAKLINDYILFELEKGRKFFNIFKMIQNFQLREKIKLRDELIISFNEFLLNNYFYKYNKNLIKPTFLLTSKLKKNKLKLKKNILIKAKKLKKLNKLLSKNKTLYFFNFVKIKKIVEDFFLSDVLAKKYPLVGLRIECNGPPKRGKQAKLIAYHQIIKDYKLFGKMPNKSILADIDYYQSFARTKQGTIGIKVWVFFYSKTYNNNYKLISIV